MSQSASPYTNQLKKREPEKKVVRKGKKKKYVQTKKEVSGEQESPDSVGLKKKKLTERLIIMRKVRT
jgi:hypothetical protein